jgi:hypothetical protein
MDAWQRDVASWARAYRDHQPGFRSSNAREVQTARDAARAARNTWVRSKTEAWRSTAAPAPVTSNDARASRLAWIDRAVNAWKTPPSTLSVPDNAGYLQPQTPQRQALWNAMRAAGAKVDGSNGDPDDPDDDPDDMQDRIERRRAAEHADRKVRLSEAWRTSTGTGNPNRANAVEASRRAVTHESGR